VLPPKDFVHLAEQNGLFQVLGSWVITTAARQARAWMAQGLHFGRIAINVSPQQIRAGSLADDVIAAADETGIPPDLIELELNESALTEYGEHYRRQIALLREAGTRICIDDFGAGVSSLTQLRRSGANAIKIDREFVQGIEDSEAASNVVRALLALTESLGVDAIADGVETIRQARHLAALGCRFAQGRLWAPPLTTASLRPLLEAGTMGVRGGDGELSTTPEPLSTETK
jgi:EAL domain-containing protein (putative c-di-GMP-specific phosphodiesterase class I)